MRAVDKVLAVALAEVGYLEKASNAQLDDKTANAGSGNYTKYARDLDAIGTIFNGKKQGYSWCAVFAIWPFVVVFCADLAMRMLQLPKKSLAAGVKYLAGYFRSAGRFFTKGPQPGDLIFFYNASLTGWAHTGLVERVEGGRVYTVEGNASGASGVTSNGGGVVRKSYLLTYNRIAGYGRPDWSLAPEEPEETGPDETKGEDEDMTGEEIYKRLTEYLLSQKPPQWVEEQGEYAEAIRMGITDGSDPTRLTTRYESAIMDLRVLKKALGQK